MRKISAGVPQVIGTVDAVLLTVNVAYLGHMGISTPSLAALQLQHWLVLPFMLLSAVCAAWSTWLVAEPSTDSETEVAVVHKSRRYMLLSFLFLAVAIVLSILF
jgi:hypothetical protein